MNLLRRIKYTVANKYSNYICKNIVSNDKYLGTNIEDLDNYMNILDYINPTSSATRIKIYIDLKGKYFFTDSNGIIYYWGNYNETEEDKDLGIYVIAVDSSKYYYYILGLYDYITLGSVFEPQKFIRDYKLAMENK